MSALEKIGEGVAVKVVLFAVAGLAAYFVYKKVTGVVSEKVAQAGAYVENAADNVKDSTVYQAGSSVVNTVAPYSGLPAILIPGAYLLDKGYDLAKDFFTLGGSSSTKTPSVTDTANTAGIPYRTGWANSDYIDIYTQKTLNETLPSLFNFSLDGK
jgi:hypothetical protein